MRRFRQRKCWMSTTNSGHKVRGRFQKIVTSEPPKESFSCALAAKEECLNCVAFREFLPWQLSKALLLHILPAMVILFFDFVWRESRGRFWIFALTAVFIAVDLNLIGERGCLARKPFLLTKPSLFLSFFVRSGEAVAPFLASEQLFGVQCAPGSNCHLSRSPNCYPPPSLGLLIRRPTL